MHTYEQGVGKTSGKKQKKKSESKESCLRFGYTSTTQQSDRNLTALLEFGDGVSQGIISCFGSSNFLGFCTTHSRSDYWKTNYLFDFRIFQLKFWSFCSLST